MDIHSAVGRTRGWTDEKLLALPDYRTSPLFSGTERVVLELADAMASTPTDIPDALYARLREHFTEAQLVELAAAIAWENHRARFNRVFQVESGEFNAGHVCALPVRQIPDVGA